MSSRVAVIDLRSEGVRAERRASLQRVCGLPVLIRNLLVLRRAGISRLGVLVDVDDDREVRRMCERFRARIGDVALFGGATDAKRIEEAFGSFESLLLWPGELSFGRFAPKFARIACGRAEMATHGGVDLGLVNLPRADLIENADVTRAIPQSIARAEEPIAASFVRSRADARAAERDLLLSLRKEADGVVAQFDRYISLAISRRLMRLPLSPNHVTIAAALIGVGCGVLAAHGGYFWMLAGALLFQLNSIFDGIDGEIARSKLLESRFGEWLDTVADDVTNFAFVVGAGIGCYRSSNWTGYLVLAAIAGLGQVLTSALQYHYLVTVAHSGDLNRFRLPWEESTASANAATSEASGFARIAGKLKWALRRDAFVAFSTIFGLLGQLRILIWAFAAGASSIWLSIISYRIARSLRRRVGKIVRVGDPQ